MATIWTPMPELKEIVEMLRESHPESLHHVLPERILYASFSKKTSKVKGKIGPIPERYAIFLQEYDYFLEVHRESWLAADEGKRLYIILHELYHIPLEGFNPESKLYKKTVPHDLEDFKDLVREYGVDLENAEKLVVSVSKKDIESLVNEDSETEDV